VLAYLAGLGLGLMSPASIWTEEMGRIGLMPDQGIHDYRVRTHDLGGVHPFEDTDEPRLHAAERWREDQGATAERVRVRSPRFSAGAIRGFPTAIEAREAAR